jgi:two-component system phosphate regulon sensor histidine kinase PhoR
VSRGALRPPRQRAHQQALPGLGRLRIGAALVMAALLGALALLVERAMDSAERERVLRHRVLATRLFDELEGELSALIAAEERRPFLHWRYHYIPQVAPGAGGVGLSRSPLAELPYPAYIAGYFQLNPDGRFVTPLEPHDDQGGPPSPEVRAVVAELEALTAGVRGFSDSEDAVADASSADLFDRESRDALLADLGPTALIVPPRPPEEPEGARERTPAKKLDDLVISTYRGARSRDGRQERNVRQQVWQVDNFAEDEQLQQYNSTVTALNNEQIQEQDQKQSAPPGGGAPDPEPQAVVFAAGPMDAVLLEETPPVVQAPPGEVDVVISPLRAAPGGADHLVLARTVRIDSRSWVQGVVLNRDALQDYLAERVLAGSGLEEDVTLSWGAAPPPLSRAVSYRFEHRFAEPFTRLHAWVGLRPVAGEGPALSFLPGLAALVALVAAGGIVAAYRLVAASLALAEQRQNFVSAVTHELKTPLTSIRMYAEMLEAGMVPGEERRREYYATMRAESERLGRLVDDVLTFSRLQGGAKRSPGPTGPLGEAVEETLRLLGPQAAGEGFALEVAIEPAARQRPVDRDAVVQILVNLVDNALKFGAKAADKRVEIAARVREGRVQIGVRDHGPGVPPPRLTQIFQPFFRGERELVRETRGTGIGLALVAGLARQSGGEARARNHPGGGLEVIVTL